MSASRSDIEEAEENAVQNQREEEWTEEGLFDMVRNWFADSSEFGGTFWFETLSVKSRVF